MSILNDIFTPKGYEVVEPGRPFMDGFVPFMQSILQKIFGYTTQHDIEAQKQLMDYQNQLNTQQWERESAYNSPAEQMKRLREAGLNPDLAIGGSVQNTAGSSPSTSLGSAFSQPNSVTGIIDAFNNSRLANAEILKRESEADFAKAQADEIRHRSPYKDKDMDVDLHLKKQQTRTEYWRTSLTYRLGLSEAMKQWSHGLREGYSVSEDGSKYFNNANFESEFDQLMSEPMSIITDVMNEYHINQKDREYLDRMFESMVTHDKEAFDAAAREFRSRAAVAEFKADNKWFQFVDYFFDKLVGAAQGITNAYSMYQLGRRHQRN